MKAYLHETLVEIVCYVFANLKKKMYHHHFHENDVSQQVQWILKKNDRNFSFMATCICNCLRRIKDDGREEDKETNLLHWQKNVHTLRHTLTPNIYSTHSHTLGFIFVV